MKKTHEQIMLDSAIDRLAELKRSRLFAEAEISKTNGRIEYLEALRAEIGERVQAYEAEATRALETGEIPDPPSSIVADSYRLNAATKSLDDHREKLSRIAGELAGIAPRIEDARLAYMRAQRKVAEERFNDFVDKHRDVFLQTAAAVQLANPWEFPEVIFRPNHNELEAAMDSLRKEMLDLA